MLKLIKDEQKLFGNLQSDEQKKLLLKIYEWVEETFIDGSLYSTDFYGYGSEERQRRFISVNTVYKDYFLFQLHYIRPEKVKETGFNYSVNNNGKYIEIKSHLIKSEDDVEKLKTLIHIAYDSVPYTKSNNSIVLEEGAFTYGENYFIYKVAPSFLIEGKNPCSISLNKRLEGYFSTLPLDISINSIEIDAKLPTKNYEEKARLGWFIKEKKYYLGFKGKIKKWIMESFKEGEYLKFTVIKETTGDTVYLEKYEPQSIENGSVSMKQDNHKKDNIDLMGVGIDGFEKYVSERGFNFDYELLSNYVFSLMSKSFVILSGISGTGKTKIAQLFAEYMCPDEIVDEVKADKEGDFIYKVQPYFIKYSRIVLPNKISDLLQTPLIDKSKKINIKFDGIIGQCWFGYANSNNKAKQILFSGEIGKHVKESIKVDDYLKISIQFDNDNETLVFEKINPQGKKIIKKSNRYGFISVRPDWVDNKSLLGFYNPITETYQPTELLKLMLRAKENINNPYFIILDEMNLAKVEHYFSDFLSCLESRRLDTDDKIISEKIILHDAENEITCIDEDGKEYIIPQRIEIPINIYFTGTVNVDETTYMFSPKVLDRANVIEFNEVDMENYHKILFREKNEQDNLNPERDLAKNEFISCFTNNYKYCYRLLKKDFNKSLGQYYDKLSEMNSILREYHIHFGYRVIDEVMMYLSLGYEYYENYVDIDLDLEILQKVLPKLNGNRKQLEMPISRMIRFCFNLKTVEKDIPLLQEEKDYIAGYDFESFIEDQYKRKDKVIFKELAFGNVKDGIPPLFPRSAKKLFRMLTILDRQGYVSFIE